MRRILDTLFFQKSESYNKLKIYYVVTILHRYVDSKLVLNLIMVLVIEIVHFSIRKQFTIKKKLFQSLLL